MGTNVAIGNNIAQAHIGSHAKLPQPAVQQYSQAHTTSSVAQVSGAARSYVTKRPEDGERVRSREVIRTIRQHLKHASFQHISKHAYQEVVAHYQQAMRNIFGESENEALLHTEAQSLLRQWRTMQDIGGRQRMVNKLSLFTDDVSSVASELQALQQQADEELAVMIEDTNNTLRHLDAMNAALSSAHMLDQPTDVMEEERDALLAVLAGYLGAEMMVDSVGAVRAFIGKDVVLLGNGSAASLQFIPNMQAYGDPKYMLGAIRIQEQDIVSATRDEHGKTTTISLLKGGALAGIQHARDAIIPETLERFDNTITNLRDGLEAGYQDQMQPTPVPQVIGSRKVSMNEVHMWQGDLEVRLHAVDGSDAYPALKLSLEQLDDGAGTGKLSTQAILREINQHFTLPSHMGKLGVLSNVQLNILVQQLPTVPSPSLRFELASSTRANAANIFMHGLEVLDDMGKVIHQQGAAQAHALAATPYSVSEGSNMLQIHTNKPMYGIVQVGDTVYLPPLNTSKKCHGLSANMLTGSFEVTCVAGNDIYVQLSKNAEATGGIESTETMHMLLCYQHVPVESSGVRSGTSRGAIHCDLRAAPNAAHYTVRVDLGANTATNGYVRGTLSYLVENHVAGLYNMRINVLETNGDAVRVANANAGAVLESYLSDKDGNYVGDAVGVLAFRALQRGTNVTVHAVNTHRVDPNATAVSFNKHFGLYPLFADRKPVIKHLPHVGAAANFTLHEALRTAPEHLATFTNGDIRCEAMGGISELHTHLCEQTMRAEEAVLEAESALEGYQQRAKVVEHIDPAEEMGAIDIYHQSFMASSRAISQISKLFQTLCAVPQYEGGS